MAKKAGMAVVLAGVAGVAVAARWAFRRAFPETTCPKCTSGKWKRLGGGLKRCERCGYSFFATIPARPRPTAEGTSPPAEQR